MIKDMGDDAMTRILSIILTKEQAVNIRERHLRMISRLSTQKRFYAERIICQDEKSIVLLILPQSFLCNLEGFLKKCKKNLDKIRFFLILIRL